MGADVATDYHRQQHPYECCASGRSAPKSRPGAVHLRHSIGGTRRKPIPHGCRTNPSNGRYFHSYGVLTRSRKTPEPFGLKGFRNLQKYYFWANLR